MVEQNAAQSRRKERVGVVVSDKMDKTIVVAVENFRRHRIYKKVLRRTARYKAHDATNDASVGDVVRIQESRPLSRLKRWRLVEVVERHEVAETKPVEIDQSVVEELEERHKQVVEQDVAPDEEVAAPSEEVEEIGEIDEAATAEGAPGGGEHAQDPAEGSVESVEGAEESATEADEAEEK
jgi:small subunit ribosomal protein S17